MPWDNTTSYKYNYISYRNTSKVRTLNKTLNHKSHIFLNCRQVFFSRSSTYQNAHMKLVGWSGCQRYPSQPGVELLAIQRRDGTCEEAFVFFSAPNRQDLFFFLALLPIPYSRALVEVALNPFLPADPDKRYLVDLINQQYPKCWFHTGRLHTALHEFKGRSTEVVLLFQTEPLLFSPLSNTPTTRVYPHQSPNAPMVSTYKTPVTPWQWLSIPQRKNSINNLF